MKRFNTAGLCTPEKHYNGRIEGKPLDGEVFAEDMKSPVKVSL